MGNRCIVIRSGTVESKYLRVSGINRSSLPIAEWKGKSRRRHGFGKAPCAWRLQGNHLDIYCEKVIASLRASQHRVLSPEEERLLKRLEGIISAGEKRELSIKRHASIEATRKQHINDLLHLKFTWLSDGDVVKYSSKLALKSWNTIGDLYAEMRSFIPRSILSGMDSAEAEVQRILRTTFKK